MGMKLNKRAGIIGAISLVGIFGLGFGVSYFAGREFAMRDEGVTEAAYGDKNKHNTAVGDLCKAWGALSGGVVGEQTRSCGGEWDETSPSGGFSIAVQRAYGFSGTLIGGGGGGGHARTNNTTWTNASYVGAGGGGSGAKKEWPDDGYKTQTAIVAVIVGGGGASDSGGDPSSVGVPGSILAEASGGGAGEGRSESGTADFAGTGGNGGSPGGNKGGSASYDACATGASGWHIYGGDGGRIGHTSNITGSPIPGGGPSGGVLSGYEESWGCDVDRGDAGADRGKGANTGAVCTGDNNGSGGGGAVALGYNNGNGNALGGTGCSGQAIMNWNEINRVVQVGGTTSTTEVVGEGYFAGGTGKVLNGAGFIVGTGASEKRITGIKFGNMAGGVSVSSDTTMTVGYPSKAAAGAPASGLVNVYISYQDTRGFSYTDVLVGQFRYIPNVSLVSIVPDQMGLRRVERNSNCLLIMPIRWTRLRLMR